MLEPATSTDPALAARLEAIAGTLADLERRLAALEARALTAAAAKVEPPEFEPLVEDGSHPSVTVQKFNATLFVSLVGRTFMVLGGAYLLRALTDSGRITPGYGVAAGLTYALVWIGVGHYRAAQGQPITATFHGLNTLLVGLPLLWEASTRFGLFSAPLAAVVLAGVTGLPLLVAWRQRLHAVAAAAAVGAMALIVMLTASTGQAVPFVALAIVLGIATLWLGYHREWRWLRWPAAVIADVMVVGLLARALNPQVLESRERTVVLALTLLTGYVGSFAVRTLIRGRRVIPFEVVQTLAVLAVGFGGAVLVARDSGAGVGLLGVAGTILGGCAYAVSFAFVERRQGLHENFYFYVTLALVFTVVGTRLLLAAPAWAILTAGLAILTTWLAYRYARLALALHGAVYALAAAGSSGAAAFAIGSLIGAQGMVPAFRVSWIPVIAAPLIGLTIPAPSREAIARRVASIPRVVYAVLLIVLTAGLVSAGLTRLVAGSPPDPGIAATIRTVVLAATALCLAIGTQHERCLELGWLAYPTLAAGAIKLLVEDFRQSEPATLFVALAAYGVALVAVPRIAANRSSTPPARRNPDS
jgi:hypothetical protein